MILISYIKTYKVIFYRNIFNNVFKVFNKYFIYNSKIKTIKKPLIQLIISKRYFH